MKVLLSVQSRMGLDRLLIGYVRPVRVKESIEIRRSPEEIWAIVAEPRNDPHWCPKVRSVDRDGDGQWRVIHKPVRFRPPAELVVEQVEVQPPSHMKLREEDDASIFNVEYKLEPIARGTRFTQTSEFEWKKLPRFLHGTFRRGVQRDVRDQLRALKQLAEG